ncbi:MAG: hypothetical protein ACI35R_09715 [Bacillus sp. (in: firmicutes)]
MRIFKWFLCIGLSLVLLSGCSENKNDHALEKGLELLKEQKYSEAATYFEEALQVKGDKKKAEKYLEQTKLVLKAKQELSEGKFEQASKTVEQIEKMGGIELEYISGDLTKLKEQLENGQKQLIYEKEIENIKTLIANKEFEFAESKLETLTNLIGNDTDMADKLKEVSDLLSEKKNQETISNNNESQQKESSSITKEEPEKTNTFNLYKNERYGFSFQYPGDLEAGPIPTNDSGREFSDGEFSVSGYGENINILEDNESIQNYYERALKYISGSVSYQKVSDNWYVISFEEDGLITYQKGIFTDYCMSTLVITYPASKKEKYDNIVSEVAKTFQTGIGYN